MTMIITKNLLSLVGVKFHPRGSKLVSDMNEGHEVLLVREPGNKYDANAIAVYVQIGYIKATEAADWGPQMDTQINLVGTLPGKLIQGTNIEVEA